MDCSFVLFIGQLHAALGWCRVCMVLSVLAVFCVTNSITTNLAVSLFLRLRTPSGATDTILNSVKVGFPDRC